MAGSRRAIPGKVTFRTEDPELDRLLRNLDERVSAIESSKASQGLLRSSLTLADGTIETVYHGMNKPVSTFISAVSDAASSSGRVELVPADTTNPNPDSRNNVLLQATGYGADVVVDIWFM